MVDFAVLNTMLADEYDGVVDYADLYKQTNDGIFKDMAREEMHHAKHLDRYLCNAGKLDDHSAKKEKAEKALSDI